jgi:16S rRNA processing protein RimM
VSNDARVLIGRVGKPHGLDGSFVVEGASSDPRWFKPGSRILIGGVEVEVLARRHARARPVIRIDRSVERGAPIEVPREALPPTAEDEYYDFELIGLEVFEEDGRSLGHVKTIEHGIANDALALESGLLLPLIGACVITIDVEAGRILVAPGFSTPD